ncbi:MAG TPA: hypothetical protein VJC20_03175 [Candidatus Paceibacterota bacterium]
MRKHEVFSCKTCGEFFESKRLTKDHENKCLPLKVGQKVRFDFGLLPCEGRITVLHPPRNAAAKPTVHLETDIEVTDVDVLHDGKHVWVERDQVCEILA